MIDKTHKLRFNVSMKTNVDLDETLVAAARQLTGLKTKKELVHHALSELVRRGDQKKILSLQGKIQWQGDLAEMRSLRG
jgi:Arc/MetJ family transcription regulator